MKTTPFLFGIISFAASVFAAEPATPQPSDKHFKIIQTAEAVYPIGLLNEGVSHGMAKAVLHVNAQGQLVDFLVVAYSRPEFAASTEQAIKKWKFEPEYIDNEPVDTITEITFNFESKGLMVVYKNGFNFPYPDVYIEGGYHACNMKNLDRIPTPVNIVPPAYPSEGGDKGITGKVVVDFYIDETGKARFVASPRGSNPLLAEIAVAAVKQWQFSPPTRQGKPVLVHAQQAFDFHKETVSAK